MMVLIDTSVWSLALRRHARHLTQAQAAIRGEVEELVREGRSQLIGPIRQELLTGIRHQAQFQRVRDYLRNFPDANVAREDYEIAAEAANRCLSAGIATTNIDLLICAVAMNHGWEIYTTDRDFMHYARVLPLHLRPLPE